MKSSPFTTPWFTLLALGLAAFAARAADLPKFTDITEQAGISFKHSVGDFELSNIVEGTAPGAMFFDFDNDGLLDIFFVNGCWHPDVSDNRGRSLKGKLTCALYHNAGNGKFTEVTRKAGLARECYGMSATCADYDNDGDLDIYLANYGTNFLFRNNGDGTFTNVTEKSGLADPVWSVHAAWFDYDGDGDLDVYVVNYLTYDKGEFQRTGAYYKAENYPGPLSYPGSQDHLFRNNGDGTFTDVTREAGLLAPNGRGMSAVAADLNGDGHLDLYVANDAMPNYLWMNDGKGHFSDKAMESGVAFGEGGQGVSSMGPCVGDMDRNGLLDIFIPDMGYGTLFLQKRPMLFMDVTAQAGLGMICGQYTGWGGLLIDFDNDGWLDVFVSNGDAHHIYTEEAVLAHNDGKGRFVDVAKDCGDFFQQKFVGRGAAYGDFDNDGDLDLLVCILNDSPHLLRNDGGNSQHWLTVAPRRRDTGMIALHSVVTIKANGLTMIQPALAANGYLAGVDPRPHFGLGAATQADEVEIRWPDGTRQVMKNVKADQILEVREGAK